MFAVGDQIIIDPGAPNEETRRITDHGSLVLDRPLAFSHAAGTRIVSLLGVVTNDSDDDGLSDDRELMMGTNPNKADTDGDGLEDGSEVIRGNNPLVQDYTAEERIRLSIRRAKDGRIELRLTDGISVPGIESSPSLEPGIWTPVLDFEQPDAGENLFLLPIEGPERFYRDAR